MSGSGDGPAGCGPAALDYLELGWSVLPVRPRDKRPLIAWERLQDERPTGQELRAWFARWPDANVGIVTGAVSGLVVLDVDPTHGGEGSLRNLAAGHAPLGPTAEAETGGGGRHLYFRHPGGRVGNRVGLRAGLDLKGDGGYVVAPPSLHPSGRRYAWRTGRSPADLTPAPMPAWLIGPHGARAGHSLADWRALVRDGVEQGRRNSTLASLTGHLLWHGVDADVSLELMLAWNRLRCRPPLDDSEVASVVRSIARLHAEDH